MQKNLRKIAIFNSCCAFLCGPHKIPPPKIKFLVASQTWGPAPDPDHKKFNKTIKFFVAIPSLATDPDH